MRVDTFGWEADFRRIDWRTFLEPMLKLRYAPGFR